jgi:methionyl aminopeptidase
MTIGNPQDIVALRRIGGIVARVLERMLDALEPGMTTAELDALGERWLAEAGARPAPRLAYGFPGATCISVNEEVAHGIPGDRVLQAGDLVNIDVSAVKDGYFSDTGASFVIPPGNSKIEKLCRDGRRALWTGLQQVRPGRPYAKIGDAIGAFAAKNRYTLIQNLASHGVGRSLHEEPAELSTWPDATERRIIEEGQVFTIEPFLSLGAHWAESSKDPWTLLAEPKALTVQFEHTIVATRGGPLILTLAE